MKQTIVVRRTTTKKNINHNLYKNGTSSMWWCHFTTTNGVMQQRLRFSLKTRDIVQARLLRDKIIRDAESKNILIWQ